MNWSGVVFVLSFLATVHFIREAIRVWRDPEFRRDLERLRENRCRRVAEKKSGVKS